MKIENGGYKLFKVYRLILSKGEKKVGKKVRSKQEKSRAI